MTEEKKQYTPSFALIRFVVALMSPECNGKKTKAQQMTGVSQMRFYKEWHKSEDFRNWYLKIQESYQEVCNAQLLSNLAIANGKLIDLVKSGDIQALKLFYQVIGKIEAGVNVSVNNNIHANIFMELEKMSDEELEQIANRNQTPSLN